jgi:hypothetical protein
MGVWLHGRRTWAEDSPSQLEIGKRTVEGWVGDDSRLEVKEKELFHAASSLGFNDTYHNNSTT